MALAISLPNLVYLYMAYTMPESIVVVNVCVAVEQFGYGFGFTAYTMYLMLFAEGEYKTSALCDQYRFHGVRYDATGNGIGMDTGADRLPTFLYLGNDLLHTFIYCIAVLAFQEKNNLIPIIRECRGGSR